MQEIKIPEGCKASIDFEKRVVVIESEKLEFKKGDVVVSDEWIILLDRISSDGKCYRVASYDTEYGILNFEQSKGCYTGFVKEVRGLATPSEAQLLFDALAKEGKKWNPTAMQIEDIEKDILVPESIGIYRCREDFGVDGDGLYIGFNNYTQLLTYYFNYNVWATTPLHSGYKRVQCKLTPCKLEDLKAGDTVYIGADKNAIDNYYKFLGDSRLARPTNERGVCLDSITPDVSKIYKVEPINK